MAFSLAKNGVRDIRPFAQSIASDCTFKDRAVPELVAATGSGPLGGFTLFQVQFFHA